MLFGQLLQAFTALTTLAIESQPEVKKHVIIHASRAAAAAAAALKEENRRMAALVKAIPNHIKKVHSQVKGQFAQQQRHTILYNAKSALLLRGMSSTATDYPWMFLGVPKSLTQQDHFTGPGILSILGY